ncbi:MAG TPA: O-antigen ligase family protein [Candidatus Moranbacteria bacterium]|nr:O-antigen ligase family protein [Candidatus Moranbacteria bacterium]
MFNYIFYFLCFFLPFQFALNPATGIDLAIVRVIIPAIFIAWLFIALKNKSLLLPKNKTTCCLLVFIFLIFISLLFSHNLSWSLRKIFFLLSLLPVYFVAVSVFKEKTAQRKTLAALVGGGALLAIFGIIQFVSQFIFGIDPVYDFLARSIAPFFLGNSFSQAVLTYPSWLVNSEGTTYMRAVANFPDPHMFSYYLGLLIPWSIALWATSKNHKKLFFIFSLLIIIADIMTFTRGSYVALITSAFIVLPIVSKNTAKKLLFGIIIFIFLLITMPHGPVTGRFVSSFDAQEGSNQGRLVNWQQAASIITSHPLGVGIGMYSLSIKPDANYREPIYAHNLYLDIAAELGIPAALVFIAFLFLVFKNFWQAARKNQFFAAGVASLAIFSFHSLVENPLYSVHVLPLLLILAALGTALTSYEKIISLNNLLLLAIFCLPLYLVRVTIFDLPTNVFEILSTIAIFLWGIKNRKNLWNDFLCLPKFLLISIGLILLGLVLSLFFNNSYAVGFGILKSWFVIPLLFSFAIYSSLQKENFLEKIYASLYFSSFLVGFIAIIYKISGIVTYDNRLQAFYSSPNYLAMYLAPGIFFGIYFLMKYKSQNNLKYIFLNLFFLTCLLTALHFTYSYGAWLAVFMSILVTAIFTLSNKKIVFAAIIFAIIFSALIFKTNTEKFSGIFSERSSVASRITIWKSSLMMLKENPWLGIGPGNFQDKYLEFQKYFPPYLEWAVPEPHNIFLAFWLQSGLLGLIGFLLLLCFVFKNTWSILKNKKDALLVAPLFMFFVYIVLHGLVDTPFWKNDFAFLFWLCVFLEIFIQKFSRD